jgi:hypothetical protein
VSTPCAANAGLPFSYLSFAPHELDCCPGQCPLLSRGMPHAFASAGRSAYVWKYIFPVTSPAAALLGWRVAATAARHAQGQLRGRAGGPWPRPLACARALARAAATVPLRAEHASSTGVHDPSVPYAGPTPHPPAARAIVRAGSGGSGSADGPRAPARGSAAGVQGWARTRVRRGLILAAAGRRGARRGVAASSKEILPFVQVRPRPEGGAAGPIAVKAPAATLRSFSSNDHYASQRVSLPVGPQHAA